MKTVNLHFAKTHLSRLVDDAVSGDDIVIAKAGKPLVRLVRIVASDTPRTLGRLAGQIKEAKDCWAADADTESLFYDGPVEPTPVRRVAARAAKKRKR